MDLRVDPRRPISPSRQIVEAVLDDLASGRMRPGERLPSVRGLASSALVNPNTVGKAYRELEVLGVALPRSGDGVFVTEAGPAIASAARRETTLTALREAGLAAVRAGHDPATLKGLFERWMAPGRVAAGGRR